MKMTYSCLDVYNRIENELKKLGKKPSPAAVEMGFNKNTISAFRTSMPKADTLAVIADFLNVSTDYLLGRNAVSAVAPAGSSRTNKMLMLFSQLTTEQQDLLIANAEMFIGSNPIQKTGTDLV